MFKTFKKVYISGNIFVFSSLNMKVSVCAPQPKSPQAILYINGARQTLALPIPQFIGEILQTSQVAERDLYPGVPSYDPETGCFDNPFHLHCSFMQSDFNRSYSNETDFPIPILEGRVYFDKEPFSLGVISTTNIPLNITYVYPQVPKRISFEVTRMANDYRKEQLLSIRRIESTKSAEDCLLQEIIEILNGDRYCGSLTSTYVQSIAMSSHHYAKTVREQYKGKWHAFLCKQYDLLHVFKYTADEIERYGLQHTCHANELRICLRKNLDGVIKGDCLRDSKRHFAEIEVHNFLRALLLTCGECDSQFLMKELKNNCPAYSEFTHPSYSVLERVIRQESNKVFEIFQDQVKGTCVRLKRCD